MLISLTVRNIALIEEIHIDFHNGMHAFTGETGAGKSLLIDAIGLLLGSRAEKELIRDGESRAYVEGVFDLKDCADALSFLREKDCAPEGDEIILSREITLSGRSVCRVDGLVWQLGLYQQLTSHLMDLHGQHAHQSLMDDKNHLAFLDSFGGEAHLSLLQDVSKTYSDYHTISSELEKLRRMSLEKEERVEFLRFQKKELENAHLKEGEEEELIQERDLYRNAGKIGTRLEKAFDCVYGASPSAFQLIRDAGKNMRDISSLDPRYAGLADRLDSLYYEAEDIGETLRDLSGEVPTDESRLEEIEERLDQLRRLSRKYGASAQDMLEKLKQITSQLDTFDDMDGKLFDLEQSLKKARGRYDEAARKLTASRQKTAERFCLEMEKQLSDLNMAGTRFTVSFTDCEPSVSGNEKAAFMIAPNRGEKPQSLSRTASGGELSRLMLAIKSVSAGSSHIPSMIFDEIDTGISGRTAQAVADKMHMLSAAHQLLCVTHLQQIAAAADHQFLIRKEYSSGRTVTHITELDSDGRVDEIARMLGGEVASARQHAAEMLRVRD